MWRDWITEQENLILSQKIVCKCFSIDNIFDVLKGKRLTKADQIEGQTPFIGSTEINNGVTAFIGQEAIFKRNAITVSYNGSVGQAFYQENSF